LQEKNGKIKNMWSGDFFQNYVEIKQHTTELTMGQRNKRRNLKIP